MTLDSPAADAHPAHVQVLTAEVRTLVVGSRQVTMSVYDQLDNVPPSRLNPFGRVSPKSGHRLFIYVIGQDSATGTLVRSYVPRWPAHLEDRGWLPAGAGTSIRYDLWRTTVPADQQREHLAEVADRWAKLDLIVLAGLR